MARLDKYLAKLNGKEGDIPAPVSTLDKEMQTLAENPPSGGGDLEQIKTDGGVGWYEYEEVIPTLTIHPSDWVLNNVVWSYPYPSMPEIVGGEKYRFTVNGQTTIVTADQEWVDDKGGAEDWVIGAWFDNSPDAPESDIELNKDIYPISERPTEDFTIRLEKVTTYTIAPEFSNLTMTPNGYYLPRTWQKIHDAAKAGIPVYVVMVNDSIEAVWFYRLTHVYKDSNNEYWCEFHDGINGKILYVSSTPDGYPEWVED